MTYDLTRIGELQYGIDGSDEYFKLTTDDDELHVNNVDEFFHENFYRETTRPAGGYFCKSYSFLKEYPDDTHGVLIVHHRYDV